MIAEETAREVARLLAAGRPQREIAARLKVSRGTISAIASGKRGLHGRKATAGEACDEGSDNRPSRCPGCGALACLPCVYCRAMAYRRRRRL